MNTGFHGSFLIHGGFHNLRPTRTIPQIDIFYDHLANTWLGKHDFMMFASNG